MSFLLYNDYTVDYKKRSPGFEARIEGTPTEKNPGYAHAANDL